MADRGDKERAAEAFTRAVKDTRPLPKTDSGNAAHLVRLYGKKFRYVKTWGRFVVWNRTHWEEDIGGILIAQYARKAVEKLPNLKWKRASESRRRREAIVALAISEPGVAIAHTELDVNPWLLNVENGTIDLRTGECSDHCPEDLITKLAPIEFDENAVCDRWQDFLLKAMGGDERLVAYLQRFAGYSLTGSTREQSLIFHYGDGNNGKSTFITTLHKLLGSYATRAARGLFFRQRHERHPTSVASLYGRRFVSVPEVDEDQEWDEGLIKDNTGDDPLNARYMRQDEWTFIPTHKLWFAANNKPRTKGTDFGIWRRMQIVPWEVTITKAEVDKKLPMKLLKEAPGILNWCIQGCLEWQRNGLMPPQRVLAATAEYRKEQDVIGKFFDDSLVFEPAGKITRPALRQLYATWCEDLGHMPVGARRFTQALRRHHVSEGGVWDKEKSQPVRGWHGVRAITPGEHAQRELAANGSHLTDRERERLQRMIDREKRKSSASTSAKPDAPGGNVYTIRKT